VFLHATGRSLRDTGAPGTGTDAVAATEVAA
jgi:hypothetical protein